MTDTQLRSLGQGQVFLSHIRNEKQESSSAEAKRNENLSVADMIENEFWRQWSSEQMLIAKAEVLSGTRACEICSTILMCKVAIFFL